MAPFVETRITRRWSAYDWSAYHAPQPMRPKTSPFYSWPRKTTPDRPSGSSSAPTSTHDPVKRSASAGNSRPGTTIGDHQESSAPSSRESSVEPHPTQEAVNTTSHAGPLDPPAPANIRTVDRLLHFIVNPNSDDQQEIPYRCSKSNAEAPLPVPHVSARTPGDVHFHIYMGGVQYWIVGERHRWVKAKLGDEHPNLPGRLLSHRPPHNTKFPNWVLASTYTTYIARDRRKRERQ